MKKIKESENNREVRPSNCLDWLLHVEDRQKEIERKRNGRNTVYGANWKRKK